MFHRGGSEKVENLVIATWTRALSDFLVVPVVNVPTRVVNE
jgi:hypothetical protein